MSHQNTYSHFFKDLGLQTLAGGSAGFVEVCIMQPLDVVKTRFQVQSKITSQVYYTGVIDCFRKMYHAEGFTSFYKGIVPPLLIESPKRAWKFATYEQFKKMFMFNSDKPTVMTYSLAGCAAGSTEGMLVTPFEVVKVSLQTNPAKGKDMPSTLAVTKGIIREQGYGTRGIFKGIGGSVGRSGAFNMIYFGFYHGMRDYLPPLENPTSNFLRKIGIGFTAGFLGCYAAIPLDVVKSRIQGPQPNKNAVKYHSTFQTMSLIYKEEGFAALYKGVVPMILRLGPGGAIMLLVFEYSYDYLKIKYL